MGGGCGSISLSWLATPMISLSSSPAKLRPLGLAMNEACGTLRCQRLEATFFSFLDSGTVAKKSVKPKLKNTFTNTFQNTWTTLCPQKFDGNGYHIGGSWYQKLNICLRGIPKGPATGLWNGKGEAGSICSPFQSGFDFISKVPVSFMSRSCARLIPNQHGSFTDPPHRPPMISRCSRCSFHLEGSLLFAITHFPLATQTCFFTCSSQSSQCSSYILLTYLEWTCILKWASWTGIWTFLLLCPLFYGVQNKELPPRGTQPLTVQLICVII